MAPTISKQVIHHLKNPFQKGSDVILFIEWSMLAHFLNRGTPTTMLECLVLLNLSFLSYTVFTQFCNTSEIGEVELAKAKKLLKLKQYLIELTGSLDKILMLFSHVGNTSNLPIIKDVNCLVKELGKVIPNSVVTEEDILHSDLGLQCDVADNFLQSFLADEDGNPKIGGCLTNTEAVSSNLQEMGFIQSCSVVIAKWIAEQRWAEHQSLLAWVQYYIQNLFAYDIFLNDCVSRCPYQEEKLNEWFSVSIERDGDEAAVGNTDQVQIFNMIGEEGLSQLIEEKEQQCEQQPGECLYYHGTDHNSAQDILESGIELKKSKPRSNFSDGKGFYVAKDAMCAFCFAKKSKLPALIIFKISDETLKEFHGLDLSDRNSDWKLVTKYFQRGCCVADATQLKKRKLLNKCNNSDYIKGPITRDGIKENPGKAVQQICIRRERMARNIESLTNIVGVIFVNYECER